MQLLTALTITTNYFKNIKLFEVIACLQNVGGCKSEKT